MRDALEVPAAASAEEWRTQVDGCHEVVLVEQHERLSVEFRQSYDRPQEVSSREVERDRVSLADAIEVAIQPQSQSARLAEVHRTVRSKDADEISAGRIVFVNGDYGIGGTERKLAGDDDVAIRNYG